MSPHKHKFSVDSACGGCGVMLSELVTDQQQEIRDLTKALAASAAKEPDPWGVQHLPGLRDGSARICINAKHGDSSDCGVCVVCQRLALTAKLEASALALQKAAKAIENHRCRSSPTWCSTHAIYHGDELCSALAKP